MSETSRPDDDTDVQPSHPRFGPFLLVEPIKRGGMGQLHLARTPWPDAPVAIVKSLPAEREGSFVSVERFRHEAELAVRLRHANLAQTYHVGRVRAGLYVAVEPVLGCDALDVARATRAQKVTVPADVIIPILRDLLSALAYVHNVPVGDHRPPGIVHRDVTPGNVIVGYDGVTKLVDFGIAKSALTERYDLTQNFVIGTPSYLAPEIVLGDPPTTAADIYGAGAVAYRLLTGAPPFTGKGTEVLVKAVSEQPTPLDSLRPDLPRPIVELVQGMMATNIAKRIRSANAALEQLDAFAPSRAQRDRAAVSSWLSMVFADRRAVDEARLRRVRNVAYPEASAWNDASLRFVHDEASPTLGGDALAASDATARSNAATFSPDATDPSSLDPDGSHPENGATPWDPARDATIRLDSTSEAGEFDETIRPEPEPAEPPPRPTHETAPATPARAPASDWHIARPRTVEPPAAARPTVPLAPRPQAPAPASPITMRTLILLLAAASIVSGVIGAGLGLYFAGS